MDIEEFAATHRKAPGTPAWLEQIPEWPKVLAAWKKGVPATAIRQWLIQERGYDPKECTQPRACQHLSKKYPRD